MIARGPRPDFPACRGQPHVIHSKRLLWHNDAIAQPQEQERDKIRAIANREK